MQNLITVSNTEVREVSVNTEYKVHDDIRRFICAMAYAHLSELDITKDDFKTVYKTVKEIYYTYNTSRFVLPSDIRNAMRMLDRRIAHCNNSLKEGEWVEESFDYIHDWSCLLPKGSTIIKKKIDNSMIRNRFNQYTMDCMILVRQMLSDAIVIINANFE